MIIILEGPDGVGKTTIAKRIVELLDNSEYIRFPGSTELGELLRPTLKNCRNMNPTTRMMLFAVADLDGTLYVQRNYQTKNMVCDRSGITGVIYRLAAGEICEASNLMSLTTILPEVFLPVEPCVFYLEASEELLDKRAAGRGNETDEGSYFRDQVRQIYRAADKYLGWNKITIREEDSVDDIANKIIALSYSKLPSKREVFHREMNCLVWGLKNV